MITVTDLEIKGLEIGKREFLIEICSGLQISLDSNCISNNTRWVLKMLRKNKGDLLEKIGGWLPPPLFALFHEDFSPSVCDARGKGVVHLEK